MNEHLAVVAASECLPALVYLVVVTALLWTVRRVPVWIHPAFLVGGLTARVVHDGWTSTAIPFGVALAVFVVLVLVAGSTVSGVTLFSLTVTLALTPLAGWPGIFGGMLVAAAVAVLRTWRALGSGRVAWLAMDTIDAVGVSPTGRLKKPELDLIPDRAALTNVNETSAEATRLRMYLPPYLLVGVALAALFIYLG